jgi:hypothetical protein
MRPVAIYVVVVVVLGLLLGAWQYRYEVGRRPPAADVIVRNLTEAFVGENTVKSVRLVGTAAEIEISMDDVRALPESRNEWPQFFSDVTFVVAARLFQPPPQLVDEQVQALQTVTIRYTLAGRQIAEGTKKRGERRPTVTMTQP